MLYSASLTKLFVCPMRSIRKQHFQISNICSCKSLNNSPKTIHVGIPQLKKTPNLKERKYEERNSSTHEKKIYYSGLPSDRDPQFSQFISSNKTDPDSFGSLSQNWELQQQLNNMPDEEDDVVETQYLDNREGKRWLTTSQYGRMIKKFLRQKKISNAIEVLETRMLKDDRAKPENYIYNLLIGGCGKVGYSKKAFKLYKQMRSRGLKVTGHTYTGLFNACANSPFPEDSLRRSTHLRSVLQEQGVLMNRTIYHSMIKAFGRCGDLETAFVLVDEMVERKIMVTGETFNFLLQACITDKKAGFRHALMVWAKMRQKRVAPNVFTFNLLLRCSRDCGLGDEASTMQAIQMLLQTRLISNESMKIGDSSLARELLVPDQSDSLPNLLCKAPTMGNIVAVTTIALPEHRLMLMGGAKGVLDQMDLFHIKPDIKTFTQLLDQVPSNILEEQQLLTAMKQANVPFDIDFFNMLIRKRCFREDFENAKDVLRLIQSENLKPDIVTFGVLAMTCLSLDSAHQFLQDIENFNYRPNVEILGTLLKKACFARDCDYIIHIMKTLKKEGLQPSELCFNHLVYFNNFASKALTENDTDDTGVLTKAKYDAFRKYYNKWKKGMGPEEQPPHPWHQFEEAHFSPEDLEIINRGKVKFAK